MDPVQIISLEKMRERERGREGEREGGRERGREGGPLHCLFKTQSQVADCADGGPINFFAMNMLCQKCNRVQLFLASWPSSPEVT